MTAHVKTMLRRKNRLMRIGRREEASALARCIGNEITRHTKTQLSLVHENVDSREMWACVRRLTGKNQNFDRVEGVTVESLNDHYSQISTDHDYTPTALRQTVLYPNNDFILEWRVFNILDTLCSTATGLDGIPSWFLRVAAPIFCSPITQLFNLSLSTSTVPRQWKQAWIRPVPKVTAPTQNSDIRPISVTPVLTRALERMIVHDFIYPALQKPTTSLVFHDQFAFRPSGSTTAAIVTLLHKVTHLQLTNPCIIVIALDFSKAFDTVRHHTLLDKIAQTYRITSIIGWLISLIGILTRQNLEM